jgi:hypothetical protein
LQSGRNTPDDIHELFVTGDDVVFDLILSDAPPDLVEEFPGARDLRVGWESLP